MTARRDDAGGEPCDPALLRCEPHGRSLHRPARHLGALRPEREVAAPWTVGRDVRSLQGPARDLGRARDPTLARASGRSAWSNGWHRCMRLRGGIHGLGDKHPDRPAAMAAPCSSRRAASARVPWPTQSPGHPVSLPTARRASWPPTGGRHGPGRCDACHLHACPCGKGTVNASWRGRTPSATRWPSPLWSTVSHVVPWCSCFVVARTDSRVAA